MVGELTTDILLVEDLTSTNSYFTNENISKEEQLCELPMLIIID